MVVDEVILVVVDVAVEVVVVEEVATVVTDAIEIVVVEVGGGGGHS